MRSKVTRYRIRCARSLKGRILDLGAGEGDFGPYLDGSPVSLDIDLSELRKVRGRKVLATAERLPFAADSFDGIWSCAVLEHVHANFILEAIRLTRVGGDIFILTPNRRSPFDPLKRTLGFGDWSSNEGHVRLYTVAELSPFGRVTGEVWWAPGLDQVARFFPRLGHTLMLHIKIDRDLKNRFAAPGHPRARSSREA
jgi:SAM-dependent methyltransferase